MTVNIDRLQRLMPDFWWFRDIHQVTNGSIRIHATVVARGVYSPDDVTCFIDGQEIESRAKVTSDYADRTFWFLPARNRFGLILEKILPPDAACVVATVSPVGDVSQYRSGQYIKWNAIEPTPPIGNIERVSGKGATVYNYHNNGLTDFLRFSGIARENNVDITAPGVTILDWGCGCGRLTRHFLRAANDPANVHGADIDLDNIDWCNRHLRAGAFSHVGLYPPTAFENESFDLIIANSVLSHLRLDAMHAWLDEVARLLKPGGLAMLSYHGCFSLAVMASRSIDFTKATLKMGFNSSLAATELMDIIPDPEYYRHTFMTDEWAGKIFNDYFSQVDLRLGVVSRYQNVAIVRK
jgi:2-polyprenyl-3-methyl-5-hydroxy-6-metoxy-1,4-benzoquinol methylase